MLIANADLRNFPFYLNKDLYFLRVFIVPL